MKNLQFTLFSGLLILLMACGQQKNEEVQEASIENMEAAESGIENGIEKDGYKGFGMVKDIDMKKSMSKTEALDEYLNMQKGDEKFFQFTSTVNEVCKAKGCWMVVDLGNGETARIKFKDYAFFVPMDVEGKEVIIQGVAKKEIMSVDELQHLAKDGGQSEAEINAITTPEETYSFMADGVFIKQS